MNGVRRGDLWDVDLPRIGRRPCVVLTRGDAIPVLARVTVGLVTTTVRGHPAEVQVGPEHGLDRESVINCDDLVTVSKERLARRRGALGPVDPRRLDAALIVALGIE